MQLTHASLACFATVLTFLSLSLRVDAGGRIARAEEDPKPDRRDGDDDDDVSFLQRFASPREAKKLRDIAYHMQWHVGKAADVVVSNLGGYSSGAELPKELRFRNVSVVHNWQEGTPSSTAGVPQHLLEQEDAELDLVVTEAMPKILGYKSNDKTSENGAWNEFGKIWVRFGTTEVFTFRFVLTGTDVAVRIREFDFTVFDIDQSGPENYCMEQVTAFGVHSYYVLDSAYSTIKNADGGLQVCSNVTINNGEVPNPSQVATLSYAQARASVMLSYQNTSEFHIAFTNRGTGPRPLLFAGTSTALETAHGDWHEHFDEVLQVTHGGEEYEFYDWNLDPPSVVACNNLGGRGPNFDDPLEIRFKKVGAVSTGVMLDLVVTSEGEYWGSDFINAEWNGANGEFGEIGLGRRSEATLIFTFVLENTVTPYPVPAFDFTVFDIDNEDDPAKGEVYTIFGASEYAMVEGAYTIVDDTVPGQIRLVSNVTIEEGAIPNPTGWESLTEEQARAAVQLRFVNTSHFKVHFKVTAHTERAFVFSGQRNPPLTDIGGAKATTEAPHVPLPAVASPASSVAPSAPLASVFGDPHLMNLAGEKFDILREGLHLFLVIPRGATSEGALFELRGRVTTTGGDKCLGRLYLTELEVSGGWLGDLGMLHLATSGAEFNTPAAVGLEVGGSGNLSIEEFATMLPPKMAKVLPFQPRRPERVNRHVTTLLVRLYLGPLQLKLSWEHQKESWGFSNSLMLLVYGLGEVQQEVGGILGKDGHGWAASTPEECLPGGLLTEAELLKLPQGSQRCNVHASAILEM